MNAFYRDQPTSRHPIAFDQLSVPADALAHVSELEQDGNWFGAGEAYSALADGLGTTVDTLTRVKLLVRAASCFEIASQARAAARTYSDSARLLSDSQSMPQTAAELFNRAALQFLAAGEHFPAGTSWRSAGKELKRMPTAVLRSLDNVGAVPSQALNLTVAGRCFNAAGNAFSKGDHEQVWACGAYWDAGDAYSGQSPNIQAFNAYRNALEASIRFYGTLDVDALRRSLPFSEEQRASNVDAMAVLEEAAYRCNYQHQAPMEEAKRKAIAKLQTARQLAATFHNFSVMLTEVGNLREAALFRAAQRERQRKVFSGEHQYGKALLYWFWKVTSSHGESLARWAIVCAIVLVTFAILYGAFAAITPIETKFDYLYFSVVTFSSLGYGDIHPSGLIGKSLACAEIIAGLMMFGILLSFVGNRLQRN